MWNKLRAAGKRHDMARYHDVGQDVHYLAEHVHPREHETRSILTHQTRPNHQANVAKTSDHTLVFLFSAIDVWYIHGVSRYKATTPCEKDEKGMVT